MSVFISHVTEDAPVAAVLRHWIEQHLRGAWVYDHTDHKTNQPGIDWSNYLHEKLAEAKVCIVLCSRHSTGRPWINYEAGFAWGQRKLVIPVCLNGLSVGDLKPPISRVNALEIDQDFFAKLLRVLSDKLNIPTEFQHHYLQSDLEVELDRLNAAIARCGDGARHARATVGVGEADAKPTRGVGWRKRVKVLHVSDLDVGDVASRRSLSSRFTARAIATGLRHMDALTSRDAAADADGSFDYIVVAGHSTVLPGHSDATYERYQADVRELLRPLLGKRNSPVGAPQREDDRILVVPGAGAPNVPSVIRELGDITLIGLNYSTAAQTTAEDLRQLGQQLESIRDQRESRVIEYTRNTPTLLVSSSAFALSTSHAPDVTYEIADALHSLGVTLHLHGRSPSFCYSHDPYYYQYLSVGTGAMPPEGTPSRLRANVVWIDLDASIETSQLTKEVCIATLEWRDVGWYCSPRVLRPSDSPIFVPPSHAVGPVDLVLRPVLEKIAKAIEDGGRYIYVNGLPGAGHDRLYAELRDEPSQKWQQRPLVVRCLEAGGDHLVARLRAWIDAQLNSVPMQQARTLVLVIYDLEHRASGTDPNREDSEAVLALFADTLRRYPHNVHILHLADRLDEESTLKDSWDKHQLHVTRIILASRHADDDCVGKLVAEYARVAPLDGMQIRHLAGSLPGFAETLAREAARDFAGPLHRTSGHYRATELAQRLVEDAAHAVPATTLCTRFGRSLGSQTPMLLLLLQRIDEELALDEDARKGIALDDVMKACPTQYRTGLQVITDRLLRFGFVHLSESNHLQVDNSFPRLVLNELRGVVSDPH